jgi:hypothetical protein
MRSEEPFEIELRIAMTGNTYSAVISRDTIAQQIIDAVMEIHYLDPKLGIGWELIHGHHVLAPDTIISELVDGNSITTLELTAKVQGA